MTHTSTELKQMLALADACAGDWDAVRPHLVVQALRDLVARVRELEASQARVPLNKTHEYEEHKKFPGACRHCGYAEHEELQHGITQEKRGMTQTTDQERAEFEAWAEPKFMDGTIPARNMQRGGIGYGCGVMHAVFLAWQASRRAQVVQAAVPGWKVVPVKPTPEMTKAGDAKTWVLPSKDCWEAMLAAAPQPPEAACNPSMQPELATKAAPVQMPELMALITKFALLQADAREWSVCFGEQEETQKAYSKAKAAYEAIEHQVRQLLAAHGVK